MIELRGLPRCSRKACTGLLCLLLLLLLLLPLLFLEYRQTVCVLYRLGCQARAVRHHGTEHRHGWGHGTLRRSQPLEGWYTVVLVHFFNTANQLQSVKLILATSHSSRIKAAGYRCSMRARRGKREKDTQFQRLVPSIPYPSQAQRPLIFDRSLQRKNDVSFSSASSPSMPFEIGRAHV